MSRASATMVFLRPVGRVAVYRAAESFRDLNAQISATGCPVRASSFVFAGADSVVAIATVFPVADLGHFGKGRVLGRSGYRIDVRVANIKR